MFLLLSWWKVVSNKYCEMKDIFKMFMDAHRCVSGACRMVVSYQCLHLISVDGYWYIIFSKENILYTQFVFNFSLEWIKVMNNNIDFRYTLSKAHLTRQIDQIKLKIINFWQKFIESDFNLIYRKTFLLHLLVIWKYKVRSESICENGKSAFKRLTVQG